MVRPLTSEDANDMADIHKACFPAGWPSNEMLGHIKKDLCLGVGAPLEAFILVQTSVDQADILTLATAPEAQRKGHARMLLEATETYLKQKGIHTLFLDVSEINTGAMTLYKSSQYQPIGRRPAYYRTPKGRVAAITFSKSL